MDEDHDNHYEDSPRNIKNYRSADKMRNGTDTFCVDHQHEARLQHHNRPYHVELDTRRSTRITADVRSSEPTCSAYVRFNKLNESSKINLCPRCRDLRIAQQYKNICPRCKDLQTGDRFISHKPSRKQKTKNKKQRYAASRGVKSKVVKRRNYRRRTRPQVRQRRDNYDVVEVCTCGMRSSQSHSSRKDKDSNTKVPDVKNSKTDKSDDLESARSKLRMADAKSNTHMYKDGDHKRKDRKVDSSHDSMSSYSTYESMDHDHEPTVSTEKKS